MTRTPSVSVVIANYNMRQYLPEAIESVLRQSVAPLEVIVVDDGSTDGSADTLRSIAARNPSVIALMQRNQGQTRAKNAGLQRARGEFVGFCDADDFWLPDKLQRQLPLFEDESVAVVFSKSQWIDEELRPLSVVPSHWHEGAVLDRLFVENFIPFGTALVRKSAADAVGGFNEQYRMGIDWDLWLRLAVRHRFRFVNEVTYMYRVWAGQMSKNTAGRFDAAFQIMADFLAAHPQAVKKSAIEKAYAVTFANRAIWRARDRHELRLVALDLWRAIAAKPTCSYPWKSLWYAFDSIARNQLRGTAR